MLLKFAFLSFVYFASRKLISDKFATRKKVNMLKLVLLGIYISVVIGLQLTDTTKLMKKICGRYELDKAILFTFIPNFLIFGFIIVILKALPGWKAPFANTLGYLCAWVGGCKKDFDILLSSDINNDLMEKIIQDKSMIINEITPSNFDLFFSQMSKNNLLTVEYEKLAEFEKLQNDGIKLKENEQIYLDAFVSLYNNVVLKDLVAEGLWYLLAGSLVITMTQNAIAEMECNKNKEEMVKEYNESSGKQSKMKSLKK